MHFQIFPHFSFPFPLAFIGTKRTDFSLFVLEAVSGKVFLWGNHAMIIISNKRMSRAIQQYFWVKPTSRLRLVDQRTGGLATPGDDATYP